MLKILCRTKHLPHIDYSAPSLRERGKNQKQISFRTCVYRLPRSFTDWVRRAGGPWGGWAWQQVLVQTCSENWGESRTGDRIQKWSLEVEVEAMTVKFPREFWIEKKNGRENRTKLLSYRHKGWEEWGDRSIFVRFSRQIKPIRYIQIYRLIMKDWLT